MGTSDIQVVNIVASGYIDREFDTLELSKTASLPVSKRTEDGRVYFDFDDISATISLSRTGQYMVSGANDMDTVNSGLEKLINSLREIGIEIDSEMIESPDVVNIVFSAELDLDGIENQFDLATLAEKFGLDNASYEPEQFPQLVYKPEKLNCTLIIFSSGKVTITGCDEFETGQEAFNHLQSVVQDAIESSY